MGGGGGNCETRTQRCAPHRARGESHGARPAIPSFSHGRRRAGPRAHLLRSAGRL